MAGQIPVSLSEILEVRCGGLEEEETWSVLGQSLEPIKRLIENDGLQSNVSFSPDSVFFLFDGSVQLKPVPSDSVPQSLLPMEYHGLEDNGIRGDVDLNKAYVYAFGAVVKYAMKLDSTDSIPSSPELYSVLNLMTLPDPNARLPLASIAQIVHNQLHQRGIDAVTGIQSLYRLIMGSNDDVTLQVTPPPPPSQHVLVVDTAVSPMYNSSLADPIKNDPIRDLWTQQQDSGNGPVDVKVDSEFDINKSTVPLAVEMPQERPTDEPVEPLLLKYEENCGHLLEEYIPMWPTSPDSDIVDTENNVSPNRVDLEMDWPVREKRMKIKSDQENEEFQMDSLKNTEDDLLLLDMESPPGHSTAIDSPTDHQDSKNPFDVYSSIEDVSSSSKKEWVSFENDHTNNEVSTSLDQLDETATEFTFMPQRPLDDDLISPVDNGPDDSPFSLTPFDHTDRATEPTFNQDPFSFFEPRISVPTNMDDTDFQMAFPSDPTSPEKSARSANETGLVRGLVTRPKYPSTNSGRLKILDELMPTDPATFTHPKGHGKFERVRSYHSLQCGFCSQRMETGRRGMNRRRHSLQLIMVPSENTLSLTVDTSTSTSKTAVGTESVSRNGLPFGLPPLLSPKRDNDSLFASFENLSSTATETSAAEHSLGKEGNTNMSSAPSPNNAIETLRVDSATGFDSSNVRSSELEENTMTLDVIPPRRPPRKADVFTEQQQQSTTQDTPVQKVELYTRNSSVPCTRTAVRGGGPSQEKQQQHVPVLGVQQAMALHRRQHTEYDDDHQPSNSERTSIEKDTRTQVDNGASTSTAGPSHSSGPPDPLISTTYRNPSFIRDSFSRSARRRPSLTVRQKQERPQSNTYSENDSSATMTMNGAGPEFIHKSRLACIRLKAPSARRKKLFRSPPDAIVHVILLSGQRVDVECHVDSTADDVFQAVSTHTNVMESHFFGLTHLRDEEHFFLEPEEKLAKYSPPGWRNGNTRDSASSRLVYTLFFRLKFYPVSLDFVKTEQTLHQIYLQLRRDVIDECLRCGRDGAYVLAAIALQAEYGDRPPDTLNYFQAEYYLPDPSTIEGIGGESRVRGLLAELHSQYAGLGKAEAEMEYVRSCQMAREYGIHFHRIYRTKPSLLLTPSPLGDPDTGTPLWIGIMPRGVVIFEERAGERVAVSQHPWHMTQTLQFDHKRFVVVPQVPDTADRTVPRRLVFFTDNYRKSCYFVRFAAAQHRFCMRMRFWATTLPMDELNAAKNASSLDRRAVTTKNSSSGLQVPSNMDSVMSNRSSETDSGISREASPEGREVYIGGEVHRERPVDAILAPSRAPLTPRAQLRNGTFGTLGSGTKSAAAAAGQSADFPSSPSGDAKIDVSIPSHEASGFLSFNETFSESMEKRLENATDQPPSLSPSDYQKFTVKLCKDPQTGLGLTLVDGEIQGLKGVYVKSLTPGGPAELEGRLRTGDKIVSINGCDLDSKTRHDAVQLVRNALGEVDIEVLRLKSLYSSNESIGSGMNSEEGKTSKGVSPLDERKSPLVVTDLHSSNKPATTNGDQTTKGQEKNKERDSVDFAKFGVTLDLDEFLEKDYRAGGVRFTPNYGAQMYAGLGGDTDEEEEKTDEANSEHSEGEAGKRGIRNGSSDDTPRTFGDGSYLKIDKKSSKSHSDLVSDLDKLDSSASYGPKYSGSKSDIDWTSDLLNSRKSSLDSIDDQSNEDVSLEEITIELIKNEHGSLGIQVAGGKGAKKVYVKALVAEPALSCPDILPGDQLASVNGISTISMAHSDVVTLLKNATSPVKLGLLRKMSSTSNGYSNVNNVKENATIEAGKITETLDVTLEKPSSGSLGLSLAKPKAGAGIYIRFINPDSVAAVDGRLKEGDRLWKINGELVAQSTPEEMVEKLKAAQGYVHLVIRRELVGR